VEITDETGKPVPGAAVSFHLPEDGPGGAFVNGLRTEVATTDAQGRASLHGMQVNRISGRFQIRIMVSKEQARAGTVCSQYITGTTSAAAKSAGTKNDADRTTEPSAPAASASHRRGNRIAGKWIAAAAVVGGGAILGILAAGRSGSAASPAAPPAGPTLTIGPPSITVGKP
jgi:hypothetical protein